YAWAEGTSMASPHVVGVAALLLAQTPSLTASELRSRLTSYAVGPATQYGVGLVNAYNSLTQRHGPPTQVYALLYSGVTEEFLQRVAAQPDGSFAFNSVEDGRYLVYGATDESSDQQLGVPGRSRSPRRSSYASPGAACSCVPSSSPPATSTTARA